MALYLVGLLLNRPPSNSGCRLFSLPNYFTTR